MAKLYFQIPWLYIVRNTGYLLVFLSLSACFTVMVPLSDTSVSYAPLSRIDCTVPPEEVHLFFEGESIDFSYQKLGLLEVSGKRSSTPEEMLDRLRYEAWQHCANGIIFVSKNYRTVDADLDINTESVDIRSEDIYTGIAVDIDKTADFYHKYGRELNTEFIYATERRLSEERKVLDWMNIFLIGTSGLTFLMLLVSLSGV